jgi:ribosomal protein L22
LRPDVRPQQIPIYGNPPNNPLPGLYSNPNPLRVQTTKPTLLNTTTTRHASSSDHTKDSNPILDDYRRQNPAGVNETPAGPTMTRGDIAPSSIFEDDRRAQQQQQASDAAAAESATAAGKDATTQTGGKPRDRTNMLRVLDPDPNARERWERKKIIQSITKGGRLTKPEFLMQTEREHMAKSEMMKTSTKKLGMLARQIQGKTLDEAIVQMRFSKKLVAQDVKAHLEAARDEAVVMRGMGLGQVGLKAEAAENLNAASNDISSTQPAAKLVVSPSSPLDIQLKDGKRHTVTDTSNIFIEQAWVGRGTYGKLPDYRARGRTYIMHTPWTSLSIVLKEEVTRVRQWQEREDKRLKQRKEKVWVPLPDRPVQGIRGQWYSW